MSNTSEKAKKRAEEGYQSRVKFKSALTKRDCARRSAFSARQIDKFEADGTLKFEVIANRKRIAFAEFEKLMPGGEQAWMTAAETAIDLGISERRLELMRKRGSGPQYKFFSPKLLRYLRASVAAWKLIIDAEV
jgi:hypothetical protein